MKISFKWPNNDKGKEYFIRTNNVTGVREVKIDGIDATKIDEVTYQFYDKDIDKQRKIEIINQMFDCPKVKVDGKEILLFLETPLFIKFMMFLPFIPTLIEAFLTGHLHVIWIVVSFICLAIELIVNKYLKNVVLKIALPILMGIASYFGGLAISELFIKIFG